MSAQEEVGLHLNGGIGAYLVFSGQWLVGLFLMTCCAIAFELLSKHGKKRG